MKPFLLLIAAIGAIAFASPAQAGGFGVYVNVGGRGYCPPPPVCYRPARVYYSQSYCPPVAYYRRPVVRAYYSNGYCGSSRYIVTRPVRYYNGGYCYR